MRKRLNHAAMAAIGFVEPWSIKAGETAEIYVSSCDPCAKVSIVELDRDQGATLAWPLTRLLPQFQARDYDLGSWIEVALPEAIELQEFSLEILFTRNTARKTVLAWSDFTLGLDAEGGLLLGDRRIAKVANERWYRFTVSFQSEGCSLTIYPMTGGSAMTSGSNTVQLGKPIRPDQILIGTDPSCHTASLNARIGRLSLQHAAGEIYWHFPLRGPVDTIEPVGGAGPALTVRNTPGFGVASARFTGEIHDPRLAPDQFDAVHLHEDDFAGFSWEPDIRLQVPGDARSGAYAIAVETGDGTEMLPFFVRSNKPKASTAFLVPTATYLAYADEELPPERYPWHGTDRGHRFAIDNGFLSLYDLHRDLSGVSLTNSRRPRATLRPDYHYPLSNSPHLLPVDLQLLKFLARNKIDIDLLTDQDLDRETAEAIFPYRLLLTGSHPEYWSSRMMSGLKTYLSAGGSLAYLGGNGFYWVVAFQGETMELRRGKNEIWTGRPGEMHLSVTGEPGGNWEDRGGNHPQALVGVTYGIMSFGPSRPYRRLPESYAGEHAWLFDGVTEECFGAAGSVLGGAAGYEIDAVIASEETPANLVRLAVADGFDESFQLRADLWIAGGEAERAALRRADMTLYRHEGGGLVFSASSVAWLGALPGPGEENDVGRIMLNLVARFA